MEKRPDHAFVSIKAETEEKEEEDKNDEREDEEGKDKEDDDKCDVEIPKEMIDVIGLIPPWWIKPKKRMQVRLKSI